MTRGSQIVEPNRTSSRLRRAFSSFVSIFLWVFSWKTWRVVAIGFASLLLLPALFYGEERVRGQWAWHRYQAGLKSRGVWIEPKDFIPPPVADGENFAMTPLLDMNPPGAGTNLWRDPEGAKRARRLGIGRRPLPPSLRNHGTWRGGLPIDLEAWRG